MNKALKIFWFEGIVGGSALLCIAIFGGIGSVALSLYALSPLIGKHNMDEREYQLFYKAGNLSAGLLVVAMAGIYFCRYLTSSIDQNWLFLCVASMIFLHGFSGLYIFMRN